MGEQRGPRLRADVAGADRAGGAALPGGSGRLVGCPLSPVRARLACLVRRERWWRTRCELDRAGLARALGRRGDRDRAAELADVALDVGAELDLGAEREPVALEVVAGGGDLEAADVRGNLQPAERAEAHERH